MYYKNVVQIPTLGTHMKNKYLLGLITAVAACNVLAGETYRAEAGAGFGRFDNKDDTKMSAQRIGGAVYFAPVEIKKDQPFAEDVYLQKISNLSLQSNSINVETKTLEKSPVSDYLALGTFYVGQFVAQVGLGTTDYGSMKLKSNNAQYVGIKTDTSQYGVGYFLSPETMIALGQKNTEASYSASAGLTAAANRKTGSTELWGRSLIALGGERSFVVDAKWRQIATEQTAKETNHEIELAGRFYPKPSLYLEAGVVQNQGEYSADEGLTSSLGIGSAITQRLILSASAARFSAKDSAQGSDSNTYQIQARYRF
jgi:hypothetical protein